MTSLHRDINLLNTTPWLWPIIMLWCNRKHKNNSRTAKSQTAVNISPNAAVTGTKIEKEKALHLPSEDHSYTENSNHTHSHFHCQPFNEVWERVEPGSTPSGHSMHCMHLSSPGLALPSHQVLNHCFKLWLSITTITLYPHLHLKWLHWGVGMDLTSIAMTTYGRVRMKWNIGCET